MKHSRTASDIRAADKRQHLQYAAAKDPRAAAPRSMSFAGTYFGPSMTSHRPGADDFLHIASKGAAAPQIERVPFFA